MISQLEKLSEASKANPLSCHVAIKKLWIWKATNRHRDRWTDTQTDGQRLTNINNPNSQLMVNYVKKRELWEWEIEMSDDLMDSTIGK